MKQLENSSRSYSGFYPVVSRKLPREFLANTSRSSLRITQKILGIVSGVPREFTQQCIRNSSRVLGNSSKSSLEIPQKVSGKLLQEFFENFLRNLSRISQTIFPESLGNYFWSKFSRKSSGIHPVVRRKFFHGFLGNSSRSASRIPPGGPREFLQEFLENSFRTSSEIRKGVSRKFLQKYLKKFSMSSS